MSIFLVITMYFILTVLFHFKHYVADFPLQNEYMLGKFKSGYAWIAPLSAHVAVHGIMTFCILLALAPWLTFKMILALALLDICIHFVMDRIKASPKMLGKFQALTKSEYPTATDQQKKSNKYFWLSLGLDQMVHGLTHELIVYIAVLMFVLGLT